MRASFFRRSRLLLLAVALIALAVLFTHDARPAQAQTAELWSATLTPTSLAGGYLGCHNGYRGRECSKESMLTEDRFTYTWNIYGESYTTDYQVRELSLSSGGRFLVLEMGQNQRIPRGFTLVVEVPGADAKEFPVAQASINSVRTRAFWRNTGLQWQSGRQVTVSMKRPLAALDTLSVCYDDDSAGDFEECVPARYEVYGLSARVGSSATHVKVMPRAKHVNPVNAWSGTLTVQSDPNDDTIRGCNEVWSGLRCQDGNLAPQYFIFYKGRLILTQAIELSPDGELTYASPQIGDLAALKSFSTLHVDDAQLDLADATFGNSEMVWSGTGLSWTEGQQVQLRLVVEETDTTVKVGTASNTLMDVGHRQKSHAIGLGSGSNTLVLVEASESGVANTHNLFISRARTEQRQPPTQPTQPSCSSSTVLTHAHKNVISAHADTPHTHRKQERHGRCRFQVILGGKAIDSLYHAHPAEGIR